MTQYNYYLIKNINYDLAMKLNVKSHYNIPKLKNINVHIGTLKTKVDLKFLAVPLLLIEWITNQKSVPVEALYPNIQYQIKKGLPLGAKVTLRKYYKYFFLEKLIKNIFKRMREFKGFSFNSLNNNNFSFKINDVFLFPELENSFDKYSNLLLGTSIDFTLNSNTLNQTDFILLLREFLFPIK